MYYRFLICKNNEKSGLFHPKTKWNVQKENGLYDVVRKNFANLTYIKTYKGKTISYFTETGLKNFQSGIDELTEFYKQYGISVICMQYDKLTNIVEQDDNQVWCSTKA